jgi:MoaA/NifB/PqqE/SkfB family radical SAM enzyme
LRVLQDRDAESDEDLLFLFLSEDQVFLKLTRTCNNICSFCCDTVFWNGTHMDPERVRAKIREGAERGLKRLFLSGGEPTIHPDFIRFIKYGKQLGYEQIITITNGRMFFYAQFATRSVRAGLSEIIFSLNSHDAATHDALVGVKGAYEQVIGGIDNVRRLGCPFRMNVVVTLKNYLQLPDMVRTFQQLGARSATFLQLVPNDRDWKRSRHSIYYQTELGREPVRAALEAARELGFDLEFKKFPEHFFEGFEEQIPEPLSYALELGEIDWRRPDRYAPFKQGQAVKCWGERCGFCAYRPFCSHLMHHQEIRNSARFDGFELSASAPPSPELAAALQRQPEAPLTITAASSDHANRVAAEHEGRPISVRLDDLTDARALLPGAEIVVSSADELERVSALPNPIQVELNRSTLGWLAAHTDWIRKKAGALTITPAVFLRLETAKREQVDLARAFETLPLERATLVNVPPCMSGRPVPSRAPYRASQELVQPVEDVPAHARHHYFRGYMTRSTRCQSCRFSAECDGVHINYVRQYGYSSLRPVSLG